MIEVAARGASRQARVCEMVQSRATARSRCSPCPAHRARLPSQRGRRRTRGRSRAGTCWYIRRRHRHRRPRAVRSRRSPCPARTRSCAIPGDRHRTHRRAHSGRCCCIAPSPPCSPPRHDGTHGRPVRNRRSPCRASRRSCERRGDHRRTRDRSRSGTCWYNGRASAVRPVASAPSRGAAGGRSAFARPGAR